MAFLSRIDRWASLFWQAMGLAEHARAVRERLADWRSLGHRSVGPQANDRLLRLDPARVARLLIASMLLCALVTWAMHEQLNERDANHAADHALAQFESRLEEAFVELQTASAMADGLADVLRCDPALRSRLMRRSLRSLHLSSLALAGRPEATQRSLAKAVACGPDGPEPSPQLAALRHDQVTIGSYRTREALLWAALAVNEQLAAVAELDPRTLADPGEKAMQTLARHAMGLTLVSSTGEPLSHWGSFSAGGAHDRLLAVKVSLRHQSLAVQVTQSQEAWLFVGLKRLALVLPLCLLVVAAGLAVYWQRALRRSRMTYRLAQALRKRQFEPFAQPIVSLVDGRCIGAEVLMRWKHPHRGLVAPGEFIETAERMGLIGPMSQLIMTRAAHRLAVLARQQPQLYFSFNLAPDQLREPGFVAWLAECFRSDTVPREQVLLEVTERSVVDEGTQAALRCLHEQHWRLAVDDFGTGHSSLALLETLPLHSLKIDRAFVDTVQAQTARAPVLDAIITLGKELRLNLIAEGVETREQWAYLAGRGVQCAQGYLMAKPMPLEAFISWFEKRNGATSSTAEGVAGNTDRTIPQPALGADESFRQDDDLRKLWERMRSTGGVGMRNRIHHLRTYRHCFVARDAVDWLVRHEGLSRTAAVRIGQRLEALGWIHHVLDEHGFADAELFFATTPEQVTPDSVPPVSELRTALRHSTGGPAWRMQTRGLLRHANAASGREILQWLQQRYGLPRTTATQWAAHLMRNGILRHVFDDQPMRDDETLYRLT